MGKLIDVDKLLKALEAEGTDLSDPGNYYNDDALAGYSRWLLNRVIEGLPHEMGAVEYARQKGRMCFAYVRSFCQGCPLDIRSEEFDDVCQGFELSHPEEAVALVEELAREHLEERSKECPDS